MRKQMQNSYYVEGEDKITPKKIYVNLVRCFQKPMKINFFVMEYKEKHMAVDFINRRLTYHYVTSSTYAAGYFPPRYFDKHSIDLDKKAVSEIRKQLKNCIRELPLERVWEFLLYPVGSSDRAYLRCVDAKGNQYTYSTVKITQEKGSAIRIDVHEAYMAFYQFLLKWCDFPEYKPEDWAVSKRTKKEDNRYADETIWLCNACGSGNLMEHKCCVTCGTARGW